MLNIFSVTIPNKDTRKNPLHIHNVEAANDQEAALYVYSLALIKERCQEQNLTPNDFIVEKVH